MSKKILLIGGGGHCKSVLDSLLELKEYVEIGIIDKKDNVGNFVMGIPIIGCDDDLSALFNNGYKYAFVTLGSISNPMLRIKLFEKISKIGYEIPVIIDSTAEVSKYAEVEKGVFIGKQCIVNPDTIIKKGSIINSGAIIEHDCRVGAFAHIAPGAVLSGGVTVGDQTHIGTNATLKQQIKIGSNTIIGIGSVVTQNIKNKIIAYGNPCREVEKR